MGRSLPTVSWGRESESGGVEIISVNELPSAREDCKGEQEADIQPVLKKNRYQN